MCGELIDVFTFAYYPIVVIVQLEDDFQLSDSTKDAQIEPEIPMLCFDLFSIL